MIIIPNYTVVGGETITVDCKAKTAVFSVNGDIINLTDGLDTFMSALLQSFLKKY